MGNAQLPGNVRRIVTSLPIEEILPSLLAALAKNRNIVLQAPPGAGKTTRIPLVLLDQPWLGGHRILMLEPRRLAARTAARRLAAQLGEEVGHTVGYRTRLDSRISPENRIEVVTEGILTRMIQASPDLPEIGIILFDEFHERSLHADLGLAFCLEVQNVIREDLRLLAMSATLDGGPLSKLMGNAPVITSEGRAFPVEIRWLDKPNRFEEGMAGAIQRALREQPEGDILVFLPGQAEIRRVAAQLNGPLVLPLYGDLSPEDQDIALRPVPGHRKVILATSIAETSLTIEGIRIVIDGGLMRLPRFDPNGGMTRLVTLPVSKASAEQRRGRAGRLGPGVCYRLWSEAAHRALPAFTPPEITVTDLAPLALELARWGIVDPSALSLLDPPPAAALAQARELLVRLGALDQEHHITEHGRRMARLPLHPRLAHMVLRGRDMGFLSLAADIAALLSERDILRDEHDSDLRLRIEMLHAANTRYFGARIRDSSRQISRLAGTAHRNVPVSASTCGLLLAFAYPDRIAHRRGSSGLRYRLTNGRGAFFPEPEPLATADMLAIAELDGDKRDAAIFLAAPVDQPDIEEYFADQITTIESVVWDSREQAVLAKRQRRLGELVLADDVLSKPSPEAVRTALLQGIHDMGLSCLPWNESAIILRQRLAFLRRIQGDEWPDLSDEALINDLEGWLGPWLGGMSRKSHLARLDMSEVIGALLSWERKKILETEAPSHIVVPSGSHLPIDYSSETPVLAVRLQEMFGWTETPCIAGVPLTLHLLSPARRPVQVTRDLASFWKNTYKDVKADLKGQYPKHYWPEDPMQAEPTARAKPRHARST